jgi:hypothetical protein
LARLVAQSPPTAGSPRARLTRLGRLAHRFGADHADEKRSLVAGLAAAELRRASDVAELHEWLLFLRVYPDDPELLEAVDEALDGFEQRADLRRHREALADTGIAGTPIHFPFHWVTAKWLAERWPDALTIEWSLTEDDSAAFQRLLPLLVSYAEVQDLEMLGLDPRAWLERVKRPGQTDAAFVIERFAAIDTTPAMREASFELFGASLRLDHAPGTPSRTHARIRARRPVFQTSTPPRARPDLRAAVRQPPRSVKSVSVKRARQLIGMAREAMITRARDLEGIIYASEHDVREVDAGDGLVFVCIGLRPEYRALVETIYVFILLKNGVPVGYYQAALSFGSAEVNFNIFEPYRGVEAAQLYARSLAVVHHMFGVDCFAVEPYQLGLDNEEALASGAFWFYYKLGYRPSEPSVKRLVARELRAMKAKPGHRSSPVTLRKLAGGYMHWFLGAARDDVAGKVPLAPLSLAVSEQLRRRAGTNREEAMVACAKEARKLLGVRSLAGLDAAERLAFERLSPLVLALPGIRRWSPAERKALFAVMRAKGARREQAYAGLAREHRRLRNALLRLIAKTAVHEPGSHN